ncbi:hypothetical protein H4R33_005803 [Dimargaris cristalligena]|uniref:Uncharacterized protein n=1 Tax=Dimargaris cristalligena TaxID=215637 RepID=A0A4P9ZY30_9FUNG|nr:hypothetical protein H4R33_005803 [Dimargaris cristalligena]RKP38645.1 hypothetical protein BJ085DRAFT_39323 [Dimargaris cristalligena]|eukprot:RKP38645.1 hypothetical protein BJ085DRAFT_39323 [Dimargaris cristalligena]
MKVHCAALVAVLATASFLTRPVLANPIGESRGSSLTTESNITEPDSDIRPYCDTLSNIINGTKLAKWHALARRVGIWAGQSSLTDDEAEAFNTLRKSLAQAMKGNSAFSESLASAEPQWVTFNPDIVAYDAVDITAPSSGLLHLNVADPKDKVKRDFLVRCFGERAFESASDQNGAEASLHADTNDLVVDGGYDAAEAQSMTPPYYYPPPPEVYIERVYSLSSDEVKDADSAPL